MTEKYRQKQRKMELRAEILTEQNHTKLNRIKIYWEDRVNPSLVIGALRLYVLLRKLGWNRVGCVWQGLWWFGICLAPQLSLRPVSPEQMPRIVEEPLAALAC